jgi:hypothetical protein
MVSCLAVAGYALSRMWRQGGLIKIVLLFVALVILHDFVGWPFYTWVDGKITRRADHRRATGRPKVPWINHVRVPGFISGMLLIIAFPLVLGLSARSYRRFSGLSESPYLLHWLFLTAVLFLGSGVAYLVRVWLAKGHTGNDVSTGRPPISE